MSSNNLTKNFNVDNISNNPKLTVNDNQTTLFNNQHRYLSNDNWITNQSTTDHKFYSYDTSALATYSFSNAQNTFLVNNIGSLVYNPAIIIPDKDKVDIANTKQEMISHWKVTTIINNDQYGDSLYSSQNYFAGDNKNWQYLKFGVLGKHIDISKQVEGK